MAERLLVTVGSVRVLVVTWTLGLALVIPQLLAPSGPAAAAAAQAGTEARRAAPRELTIAWVGDITPGSQYGLPPDAGRPLFAAVREQLRAPDLMLGNLEGTLAVGGLSKCGAESQDCFSFEAPPENVEALRWAGFDAVNVANNHAYDYGEDGRQQTLTALAGAGIEHTGLPGQVTLVRRRGIAVALVGFAPYPWAADNRELAAVDALVREAAAAADVVLVLAHLGSEGSDQLHVPVGNEYLAGEDRGDTRAFAHAAIDAGAHAVLASGPHVLRGMERYSGRPIAYSLGNFAGYRNFATTGDLALSGLLELRLAADGALRGGTLHALRLDAAGIPAPDPTGAAVALVDELGATDFGTDALRLAPDGTLEDPR